MMQVSEQNVAGHGMLEAAMQRCAAAIGIVDRRHGLVFANQSFTEFAGTCGRQGAAPSPLSVEEDGVHVEGRVHAGLDREPGRGRQD